MLLGIASRSYAASASQEQNECGIEKEQRRVGQFRIMRYPYMSLLLKLALELGLGMTASSR